VPIVNKLPVLAVTVKELPNETAAPLIVIIVLANLALDIEPANIVFVIVPVSVVEIKLPPPVVDNDAAFIVPVEVMDPTVRLPDNTMLSAYTLPLMPAPPASNKAPVILLVLTLVFVETN
jgi:hypothetical protein